MCSSDLSLRIVRDGRSDLPGPLSQLGLGRDGTVYVIAAGVAYHAGATFYPRQDNWRAIGIEAEHPGVGTWTPAQYDAYVRLVDALRKHYGVPLSNVQGHKEIAKPLGRKVDPTFDCARFRADVAGLAKRDQRIAKLEKARARKAKWQRWVARANKNIARLKGLTKS